MPFVCQTCDKVFDSRKVLKQHTSIHAHDYFICSYCGNAFQYRKSLNLHVRSKHSGNFFECDHCHFRSGRKFILQQHILRNHTQEGEIRQCTVNKNKQKHSKKVSKYRKEGNCLLQQKYDCTECQKSFTRKDNLTRHINVHHGNNAKDYAYECDHCSKKFRDKNHLRYHIPACEINLQSTESLERNLYTCLAADCELIFTSQYLMKKHYEETHSVQFIYETLKFQSREKFDEWLVDVQRSTASQFAVFKVWKNSTFNNKKLRCHRTGLQAMKKEKRVRFEKLSGSKKLDGFCPAEIIFHENTVDGTCEITIQKTHVGHSTNSEEELTFLSLDKREKNDIAHKLSLGVPLGTILLEYQVSSTGQPTGLNTKYHAPFPDDPRNVLSFIYDHKESILLFKAENEEDLEFGVLKDKDFAIVYMNSFQENLLRQYGNKLLAYDSTHKTNTNDFLLHSILIIDDDWEGVAVAFLLTNRNDTTVLELFLQRIKERVGFLAPITIMSDMQSSFHTAFEVVMMHVPQFKLWCIWHVYERWRINQKKIKDPKKRKTVIMRLYKLSQITDIEEFEKMLMEFVNNDDPDLQSFIQYFKGTYAHNARYWAYCYRINSKINTNMITESFHKFFKSKICGKKKIRTVYECLKSICTYIDFKSNYDKIKSIRPQRTQKCRVLRSRHHRAVKYKNRYTVDAFNSEEEACTHTWLISSFEKEENEKKKIDDEPMIEDPEDGSISNRDEEEATECVNDDEENYLQMYIVQRKIDFEKSKASLQCSLCDISFNEYTCTCIDHLIKCNMCKHIHAVALYCRENNCGCVCTGSPSSDEMVRPDRKNGTEEENVPVNMNNRNDDNEGYDHNDASDDNEPHNNYNEEFIEQMKTDIMNEISNLNDGERLTRIKKFIFCNSAAAPFEEKRKQRGKNEKQMGIFS